MTVEYKELTVTEAIQDPSYPEEVSLRRENPTPATP